MSSFVTILTAAMVTFVELATANAQTLNILHDFAHNVLGYHPTTGVAIASDGALYGTIPFGGEDGEGIAYELVPPASPGGAWTEVVLHSFVGTDGRNNQPGGPPLVGPDGTLYGATTATVYQIKPPQGAGTHWRERVLYQFGSFDGDGELAAGTPVFGPDSAVYGTTASGGAYKCGTIYRLLPPSSQGGFWSEELLYSFQLASSGASPTGILALAKDGSLYGVTKSGGAFGQGTVFQLSPPIVQGRTWTESTLHSFTGDSADPGLPNGVAIGPNGVLYGTTIGNTTANECDHGCGSVFELTPPSIPDGEWTEAILHLFSGPPTGDGTQPNSAPVLGPAGVLYGTTGAGGGDVGAKGGTGTIFEMVPPSSPGNGWTEIILYTFPGGTGGAFPNAVALGADGNLYGTTDGGGTVSPKPENQGTVFELVLQ
jgi:uncharacterized repeat protein (TIGR03803 family)